MINRSTQLTVEELRAEAANLERLAEQEDDPHHSKMLWNYLHHHALEAAGCIDALFHPDLMVENPRYETTLDTDELAVLEGDEEVENHFYDSLDGQVFFEIDNRLHVKNSGIHTISTAVYIEDGASLLDLGFDIDNPDAMYERRFLTFQFWPYTVDGILVGEQVYEGSEYEVSKLDPSEVVTFEEQVSVWEDYFPGKTGGPFSSIL